MSARAAPSANPASYGQPAPGASASAVSSWPVRLPSAMFAVPRHSFAIRINWSSGLEPFELRLHVGGLKVPDNPARVGVLALHLIVRANAHPAAAELPAAEVVRFVGRLPEEIRVVLPETLRILRPDQDAVQVHAASSLDPRRGAARFA